MIATLFELKIKEVRLLEMEEFNIGPYGKTYKCPLLGVTPLIRARPESTYQKVVHI